jgi:DNA modification methylase
VKDFIELSATDISIFSSDFTPPIYNVWKQQTKSVGPDHFGNSESRWLENLLYLYTDPGSIIVDPFAGSGSTIDICKKRKRRYFVSDRKPIVEREHEIRKHDLTDGPPKVPRWKDVKLVYLDPPYWKQAEGRYSNDPTDLANMPLDQFHETLSERVVRLRRDIASRRPPAVAGDRLIALAP